MTNENLGGEVNKKKLIRKSFFEILIHKSDRDSFMTHFRAKLMQLSTSTPPGGLLKRVLLLLPYFLCLPSPNSLYSSPPYLYIYKAGLYLPEDIKGTGSAARPYIHVAKYESIK